MPIPPPTPRPQSIQDILDEGRRNDEAARNAPKPHPAQQLLDYHDQIARENQVYDYDPELLAALASQNKQHPRPANYRQQPVQTAQLWGGQNDYFSEEKEAERQLKAKQAARAKK